MNKKKNEWKDREGIVFSTDAGFIYQHPESGEDQTPPPAKQLLTVSLDRTERAGKQVTLITGFVGKQADLEGLTKKLKTKCGAGGSCKDGEILIQGDVRNKVFAFLTHEGYKTRRSG